MVNHGGNLILTVLKFEVAPAIFGLVESAKRIVFAPYRIPDAVLS